MTTLSTGQYSEHEILANKYRPLLVLFPEIEKDSVRRDHHHPKYGPGCPPLDQDYHPRDIKLILENSRLPGWRKKSSIHQLLDAMDKNAVKHIDLIDNKGPEQVDKFWHKYASIPDRDSNPNYVRKAYSRLVRGQERFKDYISIQYWLAYFFDDWANVHEMDWEMVSVIIKKTDSLEKPVACVFNSHLAGFRMPWQYVHKVDDERNKDHDGLHPVVYVANGSHASYFSDYPSYISVAICYVGPALTKVFNMTKFGKGFVDFVPSFSEGAKYFPEIEVIPEPDKGGRWEGDWKWLNFKGRWGSPIKLSFSERLIAFVPGLRRIHLFFKRPIREAGPIGPAWQGQSWDNAFDWINLECYDAESTPWLGKLGLDTVSNPQK